MIQAYNGYKKSIHSQRIKSTWIIIHVIPIYSHQKQTCTFTQALWTCIIHTTYQTEAEDWLRHKDGPDFCWKSGINKVLKETPGFLPNCISMILILFSAGKMIFGGLSVNGAARKKTHKNNINSVSMLRKRNFGYKYNKKATKRKTAKNLNYWIEENTDMVK